MKKQKNTLFFVQGNPSLEDCDAAVLGVAFDGNASYGKGAADAPEAIMKASRQMDIENPMTGETLQTAIHNFGILQPKSIKEMIRETERVAKKAIGAEKFFVLLGGDHSTINGLLNAVPKDTVFVNFDAHLDLREEWQGKKESHAAVGKRIFDKGFNQIWIGVRDMINEEEMHFVSEEGLANKVFYCPSMPKAFYKRKEFLGWMLKKNILFKKKIKKSQLNSILASIGPNPVWLNIDIDCLDLREGVETGVPTPFGLTLENLNNVLYEICKSKKVIGFNLCEVVPDKDNRGQTIAANYCYKILSWI